MQTNPTEGLLGEAWNTYKAHWQHFATIALVVYLIAGVVSLLLTAVLSVLGAILASLVTLVGLFWLQGAIVKAVEDVRDGRADLSIGETFTSVSQHLGSIVGAGLLAGIGIAIGFVLLIAPGLYLLTIWSVLIPVVVLENRGVLESFGRSQELVRGHGWNVFGVILLTFLVQIAAGLVLGILLAPFSDTVSAFLSQLISGTLVGPFVVAVWVLLYFRLRAVEAGSGGTPPPPPPAN